MNNISLLSKSIMKLIDEKQQHSTLSVCRHFCFKEILVNVKVEVDTESILAYQQKLLTLRYVLRLMKFEFISEN